MKFSIIVPVYNAQEYLRECLDSMSGQTEESWECICIDDGSSDLSWDICREYSGKDPRFRCVRQGNMGLTATRNVGLGMAKGDYVGFLDCDDARFGDWLERVSETIGQTNADMVRTGHVIWHGEPHAAQSPGRGGAVECARGRDEVFRWGWENLNKAAYVWLSLVRRSCLDGFRFKERRIYREDMVSSMHVIGRVESVAVLDLQPCLYRIREGSMMHAKVKVDELVGYWEEFAGILEGKGADIGRLGLADDVRRKFSLAVYGSARNWMCWQDASERSRWPEVADAANRLWRSGRLDLGAVGGLWGALFGLYCKYGMREPMNFLEKAAVAACKARAACRGRMKGLK